MKEIDFNHSTMTRATQEDIERIYFELWSIELPKEDSMNNGHGQFTSQDAAEYIAEVSKTDSAVTICSCGAEVEAQPMKAGVCYECYRNPVTEAQQIERAIDATLHAEDLGTRNDVSAFVTLAEKHNAKIQAAKKVNPADCEHKREYPTYKGYRCSACNQVREAGNDFERHQVSRLNYKGNGYVNYK